MSVIIKGMDMPYGCANCSFVSEVTYDSKGWAKYFCKVDVDGVRGKSVTNEVISMNEGNLSAIFPDWCPLEEAEPIHRNPEDTYREDFGKENDNDI